MLSAGQLEEAEEKLRVWQPVLPETEVKTLFQNAIDGEYWRALCPDMRVMGQAGLDHLEGTCRQARRIESL